MLIFKPVFVIKCFKVTGLFVFYSYFCPIHKNKNQNATSRPKVKASQRRVSHSLKKLVLIILLLLGTSVSTRYYSQVGGKKKEKRVKAKRRGNHILTQYKSHGHADEFAKGNSGRRSRLSRLIRKDRPAWVYKSSGSRRSANRANRFLLTRSRSQGKIENADMLDRQNAQRAKHRVRGNRAFRFKKYKSR